MAEECTCCMFLTKEELSAKGTSAAPVSCDHQDGSDRAIIQTLESGFPVLSKLTTWETVAQGQHPELSSYVDGAGESPQPGLVA